MQLVESRPVGKLQQAVDQGVEVTFVELVRTPEIRDMALLWAACLRVAIGVDDLEVGAWTGAGNLQLHAMTLSCVDAECQVLQSASHAITLLSWLPLAKC